MKCIEDEIPFEVPEGWVWCRLSEIIELFSGQDLPPGRYNNKGDGIPYITGASNLENGNVIINRWTTSPTTHSTINDLLLTVKGSGVGKMAFSNIKDAHLARQIMALRCRKGFVKEYLGTIMSAALSDIIVQANGIIPGIRREIVLMLLCPLPPCNEQKRIGKQVSIISTMVNNIDAGQNDLLKIIDTTKNKILNLAIRGKLVPQHPNDEPASVLLEHIRTEKEELIKQGKLKRDKKESVIFRGEDNSYYLSGNTTPLDMPFDIPDSWTWSTLKELCDYGNCENISAENIPQDSWVLDLEDIEKDTGKVIQHILNKDRKSTSTKHIFHKNMILYSKLRPYLNKVVLADSDGFCTSEILPLDFSAKIYPRYAQIFLMTPFFVNYANSCSYGMKMPRLGTKDGQNAFFSIPPYNEQIRIAEKVDKIFDWLENIMINLV